MKFNKITKAVIMTKTKQRISNIIKFIVIVFLLFLYIQIVSKSVMKAPISYVINTDTQIVKFRIVD